MSTEKLQSHISQNSLVQMFKTRGQTNADNNKVCTNLYDRLC